MKNKTSNEHADSAVVSAAIELQAAIDRMERLTARSQDPPLSTRHQLMRAGEFLQKAAESHQDFIDRLTALSQAVDHLRARQNASAQTLSECAQRLDDRRKQCDSLDERFAAIGKEAREIGAQMTHSAGDNGQVASAEDAQRVRDHLVSARERLSVTVEQARALTQDARDAGLIEVERQAHSMRQQLESLLHKLDGLG